MGKGKSLPLHIFGARKMKNILASQKKIVEKFPDVDVVGYFFLIYIYMRILAGKNYILVDKRKYILFSYDDFLATYPLLRLSKAKISRTLKDMERKMYIRKVMHGRMIYVRLCNSIFARFKKMKKTKKEIKKK